MKALNQFITILFFCTLAFCQHRPHISSQWSAIVEIISIPGDVYEGNGGYYGFVLDAIAFMVFDNDNQRSYVESALTSWQGLENIQVTLCDTQTTASYGKYYGDITACLLGCCNGVFNNLDYFETDSPFYKLRRGLRYFHSLVKNDDYYDDADICACQIDNIFEPLTYATSEGFCESDDLSGNLWVVTMHEIQYQYCIQTEDVPLFIVMNFDGTIQMNFNEWFTTIEEQYFVLPGDCGCE